MLFWLIGLIAVYSWRSWWAAPVVAMAGAAFSVALAMFVSSGDLNGIAVSGPNIGAVALAAMVEWGLWSLAALTLVAVLKVRDARRRGRDKFSG